jgi:hypothetical protein
MHSHSGTEGIKRLIAKYRGDFRRPENIEHYDPADYRRAERKYVQFCLTGNSSDTDDGG